MMKKKKLYRALAEYITGREKKGPGRQWETPAQEKLIPEKEVNELKALYAELEEIHVPGPSGSMKSGFLEKLEHYKRESTAGKRPGINWQFPGNLFGMEMNILKPALFVVIFLLGTIAGLLINNNRKYTERLISELQNSRQALILALIEQPSAAERLKAVDLSARLDAPDETVISALFTTLNQDENINVRLAATEALFGYSDQPGVSEGLVESISHQDSPLVLITLSRAMVILREKDSVDKLRQLLNDDRIDGRVKDEINESIQKII